MLRESVIRFMGRECPRELIRDLEKKRQAPPGLLKKMAALGWTAIPFPRRYQGLEGDLMDVAVILEEFGRLGFIAASVYNRAVLFGGMSILTAGSEEQKERFLPRVCQGEVTFALALSEPEAGSDAANVQTKAVPQGDGFVIDGHKTWITGADVADYLIVPCRTDPGAPKQEGITNFMVERSCPGVEIRTLDKIGNNLVNACEIYLDGVEVPRESILGGLNQGFGNILKTLKYSRMGLAASATGTAQAAVDDALRYAKERVQFGRPIGKFQVIRHRLAEMQMRVDASRLMARQAAWLVSQGLPCERETAMAKVMATETLQEVSGRGMQILGAYGYSTEFDMQRYWRDGRLYTVGEGTTEIQKEIIARTLGL
jgi:alkylation response protein AidB-like acyl-CoA dehydrogenase